MKPICINCPRVKASNQYIEKLRKINIEMHSIMINQAVKLDKLKADLELTSKKFKRCDVTIQQIRSAAVNEFWSKLKEFCDTSIYFDSSSDERDFKTFGDNLVKEMAGDDNA